MFHIYSTVPLKE